MKHTLDAVETALLLHLHAAIQTGIRSVTTRQLADFLESRKVPKRLHAVLTLFTHRGYISPSPISPAPVVTGSPVAGSTAAASIVNWNRTNTGPDRERWTITARVIEDARDVTAEQSPDEVDLRDCIDAMKPSHREAYQQVVEAVNEAKMQGRAIHDCKAAYAWLKGRGVHLPKLGTFTRYVRSAQRTCRRSPFDIHLDADRHGSYVNPDQVERDDDS